MTTDDAIDALATITVKQLRERLDEIEREAQSLRVLLRSALARQAAEQRRPKTATRRGSPEHAA
jgi:hypothetical protein